MPVLDFDVRNELASDLASRKGRVDVDVNDARARCFQYFGKFSRCDSLRRRLCHVSSGDCPANGTVCGTGWRPWGFELPSWCKRRP